MRRRDLLVLIAVAAAAWPLGIPSRSWVWVPAPLAGLTWPWEGTPIPAAALPSSRYLYYTAAPEAAAPAEASGLMTAPI